MVAIYKISFGVLGNIGTFNFKSDVSGEAYTLAADAKIDTTVFDYNGNMTSMGTVLSAIASLPTTRSATSRRPYSATRRAKRWASPSMRPASRNVKWVPPDLPAGLHPGHPRAAAQRA